MNTFISKSKFKKGDAVLIGGKRWIVEKRSLFPDRNGFYTYHVTENPIDTPEN